MEVTNFKKFCILLLVYKIFFINFHKTRSAGNENQFFIFVMPYVYSIYFQYIIFRKSANKFGYFLSLNNL